MSNKPQYFTSKDFQSEPSYKRVWEKQKTLTSKALYFTIDTCTSTNYKKKNSTEV
jgi:hypothetical protein